LNRDDFLEKAYRLGFEYEKRFGGCSQCTLLALEELLNLDTSGVFAAAHALCAGAGLSGKGSCGALSGGILAIGLKYGREKSDLSIIEVARHQMSRSGSSSHIPRIELKSFELSKKLIDRFMDEYGGVTCENIQKKLMGRSYDSWDPEDYRMFEEAGGHVDKCTSVVGNAVRWVAEIFLEEAEK
jgi:C_GCAxxG_C_C family probable redox protein